METSLILLIIGIVAPISGVAAYVAKKYLEPSTYAAKTKKLMDNYIAELEEDNKSLQKQINAMKRGAKISEDTLENPTDAIAQLIPQFEHLVPAKFKPFLRDPKLMQYATKMISENPEAAKKILSNFVSKKGPNKELLQDGDSAEVKMSV